MTSTICLACLRLIKQVCTRITLVSCVLLAACGGKVELLGSLPESEANEVVSALLNAGIEVVKVPAKEGLVSLEVESGSVARALGILQELGLPRQKRSKMGEVFKKENLISSSLEERARYLFAISQELEQTLLQIDGVVSARVHVVLPEKLGPGDPNLPSSSAVFIKHLPGFGVENLVNQVRSIVANSVPGLGSDKVTVALVPAKNTLTTEPVRLTNVLFFRVAESSATAVITFFCMLGLLSLLGMASMVYQVRQTGLLGDLMRTVKGRVPGGSKAADARGN